MTLEELLSLPLAERVKWLRSDGGPAGKLSLDTLADKLGTSRQTVIGWENGVEPRRYADRLAEFSGFPREVWLRRGAEAVSLASIARHLGELADLVAELNQLNRQALEALARASRATSASQQSRSRAAGTKR